jgi:hypothetical protein
MLVSVQICDANGEVIQNRASSKEIPDYDDFEKKGLWPPPSTNLKAPCWKRVKKP